MKKLISVLIPCYNEVENVGPISEAVIKEFEANLNAFIIKGTEGGDIPEAVYEAMYASLEFYKWDEDAQRKIILIGDAEPHPKPRGSGKYSKDLVMKLAAEKEIAIDAIITPDDKGKRGR